MLKSMNDLLEEVEVFEIDFGEMSCQFNHGHQSVPASCRTCLEEVTSVLVARCGTEAIHLCEAAAQAARKFIATALLPASSVA